MVSALLPDAARLRFRPLTYDDHADVAALLADESACRGMHFQPTREIIAAWLVRAVQRCESRGFSHWHVSLKSDGRFVGIIGLVPELVDDVEYIGLGYLIHPDFRRMGYALEGAQACIDWAFARLGADQVIAEIAVDNLPSIRLAEKLGMSQIHEYLRPTGSGHFPHFLYAISRRNDKERSL